MAVIGCARSALGGLGSVVCRALSMRVEDRARAHRELFQSSLAASAAVGARPGAVSVEDPAPASGHLGFRTLPGAVDDAAGDPSPPTPAASLTFVDWATPAICDVLADHRVIETGSNVWCEEQRAGGHPWIHANFHDAQEWREHVAPLIAARLESAGAQRVPPLGEFDRRCLTIGCGQPLRWHDSMKTWHHYDGLGCLTPTPS